MTNLLTFPIPAAPLGIPPDAAERERALDITQSFIVEAPAGSGKTGLLVQRFLKLLAAVDDPAQVLAITFTRKATAELRERILAQLTAAHAAQPQTGIDPTALRCGEEVLSTQAAQFMAQAEVIATEAGDSSIVHDGVTEPSNLSSEPLTAFDRTTRTLAQAVLAHDAALGWNLLDHPRRLHIRTIDAVSRDIASALPVLSGSGGALAPTEDAAIFHAGAARQTLMQLGGPDRPLSAALEDLLLHRDGNLANCETLIATMLATRDQWAELIPPAPAQLTDVYLEETVLPKLNRALDLVICRGLTAVTQALPHGFLDDLCTLAADMAHAEGYNSDPSPLAFCAGDSTPPAEKSAHLDHWLALVDLLVTKGGDFRNPKGLTRQHLRLEIRKEHKQELARLTDNVRDNQPLCELLCSLRCLPPATYPPEQWRVTKSFFRVLAHALAELQLVFASRSACDFTEVALLASSALQQDAALEDLATTLGSSLLHLLVDEMQDTSSSQYELIHLLTQHWNGHSQTIFLVGDPKQSIYLFRQARVERFVQLMRSATLGAGPGALSLTPLRLTANFRSQAPLVHAFNRDFALIFPAHSDATTPERIPYSPATPTRPATNPHLHHRPIEPRMLHLVDSLTAAKTGQRASDPPLPPLTWHANPIPNTADRDEKATLRIAQTQAHAQEIRTLIEQWRARPLPPHRTAPWKIAILVQARTHLPLIVQALKQPTPIPYRAVDIEPLAERQEILDLLALTRALLHPADRTAWLALLRSPFCGLTLADLHRLAGQDDRSLAQQTILQLISDRGDLLSEDGIGRLQPFWTVMTQALAQRGRHTLSQWVSGTWQAFQAPSFATSEARANTETYLALLDRIEAHESNGAFDLALLSHRLKKLYAAASLDPHAVDLITIHKAKGLEWDFVIVPALDRTGRTSNNRLLDWIEIPTETGTSSADSHLIAHGILAPVRAKGGPAGKLNAWIRTVDSARAAAERKRLFYVACTRAREELHLFATPDTKVNGELSVPPASLLAAAWPAAASHFVSPTATMLPFSTYVAPLAIAAAATRPARLIQRIPLPSFAANLAPDLKGSFTAPVPQWKGPPPSSTRPQGSFAVRTMGNTLHAFLQSLAVRISAGEPPADLRADLETWPPRVAAVLRASGIPPSDIQALTQTVLRGLTRTLDDPHGRWLLAPHSRAATELALTSQAEDQAGPSTIRLDRTFLAGPTPLLLGDTHRWIIDYKTATHAEAGLEDFLERERQSYAPQLETYAASLAAPAPTTRLALYYPLLSRLLWWPCSKNESPSHGPSSHAGNASS